MTGGLSFDSATRKRNGVFQRVGVIALTGMLSAAGLALSAGSHAAKASDGCTAINEGDWSVDGGSSGTTPSASLEVGEVVNIAMSGSGAGSMIIELNGSTFATYYRPASVSATLNVATAGSYRLNYNVSDGSISINASCEGGGEEQTITFGAQSSQTFSPSGTFAISPEATASSELSVTYSSLTESVCTVSGTTVTILSAGTCTIAADQEGDDTYAAAEQVTQNVEIGKADQTITFDPQDMETYTATGTFVLSPEATSTSGLDITYSSETESACTVSGTTVTMLSGVGTCTITASQSGDDNYNAAEPVTQSIALARGTQTITFDAQSVQTFTPDGTFSISPTATASSELSVSYSSTTLSVCTVDGTTVTMLAAGTCTIAADQGGDDKWNAAEQATQDVLIAKGTQTITFDAQDGQTFSPSGTFEIDPTATASSGLPVTYSSMTESICTVSGTTVTMLAAGTCTIAANSDASSNYNAANQVTQNVIIDKGNQTISFTQPDAQPFAPGLTVDLTASATSSLTVTFTSNSEEICTVSGSVVTVLALGTCSITATQAGNTNYNAAEPVTQTFEIEQSVTTTALSVSPSAPLVGQVVTFSVTVTSLGGTPTGTVNIVEGSTTICTITLASGAGSCTATFDTEGLRTFTAEYAGSNSFAPSESSPADANVIDQVDQTVNVIASFLSERNNQILVNEPEKRRQIDRLDRAAQSEAFGIAFAETPTMSPAQFAVRMAADGNAGPTHLAFATSLSQIRGAATTAERQSLTALGYASGALPAAPEASPFDMWIEGKYAALTRDAQSSGHFGLLSGGIDYVANPNLLIGLMGQIDALDMHDDGDSSSAKGLGYLIGPYTTVRLGDRVFLQARAGWGQSSNEVSPYGTYTDTFTSTRWLASATLTGSWSAGPWRFDPQATVSYMEDTSDAYLDTYGTPIPSVKSVLGQMRAGPEIAYRTVTGNGTVIEPFANAELVWNFADGVTSAPGIAIGDDAAGPAGARGRVEMGVRSLTLSGFIVDMSLAYDGIGAASYRAWTGKLSASIPLK